MTKSRTSNSSVCRVHKNANYTVMSNYHLQSRNLSLKAIGLLSKVFSLPDDWDYSIAGLTHICKENETAIKSALNELKEWGYLTVSTDYLLCLDDRKYVETTNLDEKQIAHFQQLMDDVAKNNI